MRATNRHSGYTILEVVISMAILVSILAVLSQALRGSADDAHAKMLILEMENEQRRLITLMGDEISDSGQGEDASNNVTQHVTSHPGDVETPAGFLANDRSTWTRSITFQRRLSLTGVDANDWGPAITYQLGPSGAEVVGNHADDDGDGVIDEQKLQRVQNGTVIDLADNVIDMSFHRAQNSQAIEIILVVARRGIDQADATLRVSTAANPFDPDEDPELQRYTRRAETTVSVRNR